MLNGVVEMPKQTFFNLPEDKKEKIIAAARKEFSRVSLYEASISNIIKDADISRGSFYQYFENKEDAFFLVLEDLININEKKFKDILKETQGDLIKSFVIFYEYLLQFFTCEKNKNFFKNAFLNMSHRIEQTMTSGLKKKNNSEKFKGIIKLIDISKLNIKINEDIHTIFRVIVPLTTSNIVESFAKQLSFEKSVESYKKQLDIIKNGIYKN